MGWARPMNKGGSTGDKIRSWETEVGSLRGTGGLVDQTRGYIHLFHSGGWRWWLGQLRLLGHEGGRGALRVKVVPDWRLCQKVVPDRKVGQVVWRCGLL